MDAVTTPRAGHRPDLPLSIGFAVWADAWLRGAVSLDDAYDAISGPEQVHLLSGLPQVTETEPLILGLGRLRGLGARGARVCLPAPSDPVGLAGPPAFNQAALEHGGAVLVTGAGWGLLPVQRGSSVLWTAAPARTDGPLLDPGEADRSLRAILSQTATALAELEVARWSPDVADELMALRRTPDAAWPPGVGQRTARVLELAMRCLRICDLALTDAGGARTASEIDRRKRVLDELSAASRRAVVAALGSPQW